MARYLFPVWPLTGHLSPNLAVAGALARLGHEVAFYTGAKARKKVESAGFRFFPFERLDEGVLESIMNTPSEARNRWRRLLVQRERYMRWLGGTLEAQSHDLEAIYRAWNPDVVVCDPMMWAPYIALAEKYSIPTAIFTYVPFCLTPSDESGPIGMGLPPPRSPLDKGRARVAQALFEFGSAPIRKAANEERARHGLPPLSKTVSELATDMPLYLVAGSPEFDYGRTRWPESVRYIGACLSFDTTSRPCPEWIAALKPGPPVVHVTEGTVHVEEPFLLKTSAEALGTDEVQVVIATGAHREPAELGLSGFGPAVRVESWVDYGHLLPQTDVVVATGGAGVVLSALVHGIPLVLVPTEWDKPEVARRAEAAGAAVRIDPAHCTPQKLREAVRTVLNDASFQESARRLAESFSKLGGPAEGARLLDELGARVAVPST